MSTGPVILLLLSLHGLISFSGQRKVWCPFLQLLARVLSLLILLSSQSCLFVQRWQLLSHLCCIFGEIPSRSQTKYLTTRIRLRDIKSDSLFKKVVAIREVVCWRMSFPLWYHVVFFRSCSLLGLWLPRLYNETAWLCDTQFFSSPTRYIILKRICSNSPFP